MVCTSLLLLVEHFINHQKVKLMLGIDQKTGIKRSSVIHWTGSNYLCKFLYQNKFVDDQVIPTKFIACQYFYYLIWLNSLFYFLQSDSNLHNTYCNSVCLFVFCVGHAQNVFTKEGFTAPCYIPWTVLKLELLVPIKSCLSFLTKKLELKFIWSWYYNVNGD